MGRSGIEIPEFMISLDFELLWGVRDHADRDSYGHYVLGGRKAIPRILDLFESHGIHATWATVGMLFCENRDELLDVAPHEDLRPRYINPRLSNYKYIDEVGFNESLDKSYFAISLIKRIQETPHQEIGTHTFSHYYCLEPGASDDSFTADIDAAQNIAARRGINLRSIVFPRNQYSSHHVELAERAGIAVHRANQCAWPYRARQAQKQTLLHRAARLADAYLPIYGRHAYDPMEARAGTARASAFLRPASGTLGRLHDHHVGRIIEAMTQAAQFGQGYHLWWHPHNFGMSTETCLAALSKILRHFVELQNKYGMVSRSMYSE